MHSAQIGLKVELLAHTGGELIAALAAKLCYSGASISELQETVSSKEQSNFLKMISDLGHHSVFEHVSFTFGIEGVSRTLTHQLVRHRVASFSQKSQRYVKHSGGFEYITPPLVQNNPAALAKYENLMQTVSDAYDALTELGVPAEDARYILPNATETKIIVTMNARELLHFFAVRCCMRAQWEIREMSVKMLKKAFEVAPSIFSNAGPACVKGACSEGKMTCGLAPEIRRSFRELLSSK